MGRCWLPLIALCAIAAFAQDSDLTGAREAMGRGVHLLQRGNYPQAAKAFEAATHLAPTNLEAKLYLGICYMAQFRAGSADPGNLEFAHKAETQFLAILQAEPADDTALQYMADLQWERATGIADPVEKQKQIERAQGWFEELEKEVPRNKEAPFMLAVMAYQEAHAELLQARIRAGMNADEAGPLKDAAARAALAAKCGPLWDQAIAQLTHALDVDPDYDNAMAYMNLVLRDRADTAATQADYQRQIEEGGQWIAKAMEARKRKAHAPQGDQ
jgi:hypothetical protein